MNPMRSFSILGARVIDPASGLDREGDVHVVDGVLAASPAPKGRGETQTISAQGLWVLPGLIDLHVHLREPGDSRKETIESGLRAAVKGGFTSVACMANTRPTNDHPSVTAWILKRAAEANLSRVFPVGAVSKNLEGKVLAPIASLVAEGARAISDDGRPVANSRLMRQAMEIARSCGTTIISHAEDPWLMEGSDMNEGPMSAELGLKGNPAEGEEIMVAREIALSRLTGCAVHIAHVSTARAVRMIREAKKEGVRVTAEVTPHHLTLTDRACASWDTHHKMAPPLRSEADQAACLEGLADGTIDCIASDHAPHGCEDKKVPWPEAACGVIGLETSVAATYALVVKKKIGLRRWIEALTSAPAKILGIPHGSLRVGSAADLVVFDPAARWKYSAKTEGASLSANSPFEGWSFEGRIVGTYVNGQKVFHEPTWRPRS